jgi:ligand-binding sensor domain-containing protein
MQTKSLTTLFLTAFLTAITSPTTTLALPPDGNLWDSHLDSQFTTKLAVQGDILWVATQFGGVVRWDTTNNEQRKFTRASHCIPDDAILDISATDAGDVWIATFRGVGHKPAGADPDHPWLFFNEQNSPLTENLILAVQADPNGGAWVGTFDSAAFHVDANFNWTHYFPTNSDITSTTITSFLYDDAGNIWIGFFGGGVDRFDGANFTNFGVFNTGNPEGLCIPSHPPDQLGLTQGEVYPRAQDPVTGALWFSCHDDPIFCDLDGTSIFTGTNWSAYTTHNSDINYRSEGVAFDSKGQTWIASLNGVQRFNNGEFTDEPVQFATSVVAVGDDIWFGSQEGLIRRRDDRYTSLTPKGILDTLVEDIAVRQIDEASSAQIGKPAAEVWIANRAGAQWHDGTQWHSFTQDNSPILGGLGAVAVDLDGSLWFGTRAALGVQRFDGEVWTTFLPADTGLINGAISHIAIDPTTGEKWFGDRFSGGLVRYDGNQWQSFLPSGGFNCDAPNGVPGLPIADIDIDENGDKWIASNCGLSRFDGLSWTTFTQVDGLPHTQLESVATATGGVVWAGTHSGVARFDGESFESWFPGRRVRAIHIDADDRVWAALLDLGVGVFQNNEWTVYTVDDGLVNPRVVSLAQHPDRAIWIGTELGISVIAQGGPNPADPDADGDTDLFDVATFLDCVTGPTPTSVSHACSAFDLDLDNDIDFTDLGQLQILFSQR